MTLRRPLPRPRSLAASAATITLGLGLLAGCGSDDTDPVASDPGSSSPPSTEAGEPSGSATPQPDPAPSDPATSEGGTDPGGGEKVAVPVYFVGDSPTGPRLYREFRSVDAADPLAQAVALLVAGDALDPDYYSLLPDLDVVSVEATDSAIVVTLGADSPTSDKAVSPAEAKIAVQSLVYTLQGVAQTRAPVMVRQGDQPVALLGRPTDTGVKAGAELKTLSLVNVTNPESDARVSGTLAASGVASSFEATVLWEIRDESGAVALDGFATADGFMDKLYPWETDIDVSSLQPGSYTFAALTDDSSSGEGPGPYEDTKAFTVGP